MTRGLIFEIREFSLFDGPGIRTTLFLKGCPLRCAWCHNPEGIRRGPELLVNRALCGGCGRCRLVCPHPDGGECDACGRCVPVCPKRIRRVCGQWTEESDLIGRLVKQRDFFGENGGVTFSGGEPLAQAEFTVSCLKRLREEKISTAVETCGYAPEDDYRAVINAADLILQDLKHPDDALHRRWTGRSNGPILRNLRLLKESGCPFIVRIPLIPTVNDDPETLEAFAELLTGSTALRRVELLPFHAAGHAKESLLRSNPSVCPPDSRMPDESLLNRFDHATRLAPFLKRGILCRFE